ncbi:metal-dependent phosphohydrolase [Plantactinospora sp. WMMB334]|uniref:metal-dependent phosphohydrolase n=1 Tax=Plantactinospora sp. WMMB334 TaxID=3404119 RepID=UPI003B928590
MTALTTPRHPLVVRALAEANTWCFGHVIDDRPAYVHAVRVAATLVRHLPDASPHLVAAVLLHDAPEFVPPDVDLDRVLTATYGPEVPRIIRALQVEHHALDEPDPPINTGDRPVLLASTADKIVALTSLLRRAREAAAGQDAFFAARPALLRLLPHFHAFHEAGAGLVPASMSEGLRTILTLMDRATESARQATAFRAAAP